MTEDFGFSDWVAYRVYPIYNYFGVHDAPRIILDFFAFFLVRHHWFCFSSDQSRKEQKQMEKKFSYDEMLKIVSLKKFIQAPNAEWKDRPKKLKIK